jgi:hypothetical protein
MKVQRKRKSNEGHGNSNSIHIAVQTIVAGKVRGLQDTSWITTLEVGEY